MRPLQRDSKVPLYRQLKEALRLGIEAGEWRPGEQIPSEPELSASLGIARGTVRGAILELVREGWLERRQGGGTYVARRHLEQDLMRFYSFAREARQRGLTLTSRVLEWERLPAGDAFGARLGLGPEDELLRVARLRQLDGEPVLIETCFLPATLARPLSPADFSEGALYDALEQRCGVAIIHAAESFEAAVLTETEASVLHAVAGAPALRVERIAYAAEEQPVEFRQLTIRGDRCRYHIEWRGGFAG